MRPSAFFAAVFSAASTLLLPAAARACAVCLTGAENDPLTDAFNWSVLFLMAMPYTVVGSIGGWLALSYWRAARKAGGEKSKRPILRLAWTHKETGR